MVATKCQVPPRISSCNRRVVASEAKKAGNASEDTLLMPRPPDLMGKLACSHCESDIVLLVIRDSAVLSKLSKSPGSYASTEGEQRSKCWTLGALNDARGRISASWRPTRQSLSTALERSRHWSDQKSFKTLPGKSGASRRVASAGSTRLKDRRRGSSTTKPEWVTCSHFAEFKTRLITGSPGLFTDTSEHIRFYSIVFYFLVFLFSTVVVPCCRLI